MRAFDLHNFARHTLLMLLELPIGIALFTIAVTGLALSAGLLPLFLLGIPLFIGMMGLADLIRKYELARCRALLGEMPAKLTETAPRSQGDGIGILQRAVLRLTSADSWKGILLMLLKLPIGIVSFTVIVVLLAVSLGLVVYPVVQYIVMNTMEVDIYENSILALFTNLSTSEQSLIYFGIGLLVTGVTVRIVPAVSKAMLRVYASILKL